jgi:nucleoside-diphosphate-sugar epimerase
VKDVVLILGGAGFLGSHLVSGLISNYSVYVLERKESNLARLNNVFKDIEIIYDGQIEPADFLKHTPVDYIVNCAVDYGRSGSLANLVLNNIVKPMSWLEASEHYSKAFVNVDSFFNKPENRDYKYLQNYIYTKKHLEEYLGLYKSDLRIINMKLEHLYGPYDNAEKFIPSMINKMLANEEEIHLTPGEQLRDFVFVKDVVSAIITILRKSDQIHAGFSQVSVGTGKTVRIKELVSLLKTLTGSASKLMYGKLPYRENEIMRSAGDPRFLASLGWKCNFTLESGLKETVVSERQRN